MKTKITLHTNKPVSGEFRNWRNIPTEEAEELIVLLFMFGLAKNIAGGNKYSRVISISEKLLYDENYFGSLAFLTYTDQEGWEINITRLGRIIRKGKFPFEVDIIVQWQPMVSEADGMCPSKLITKGIP